MFSCNYYLTNVCSRIPICKPRAFLVQIIQTTFISKVLQKGICILLPSIKVFIAHLWLIKYTAAHRPFKSSFDCFLPYLYVISDDARYYIRRYNPTNFESEEYIWSSHFNVSQRIVQLILTINKSFLRKMIKQIVFISQKYIILISSKNRICDIWHSRIADIYSAQVV